MSEYKFTVGEYVTRDGRKAVVLCDDAPGTWPLKGYAFSDAETFPVEWSVDGRWLNERENNLDLMPPAPPKPEPVECWVNLYRGADSRANWSVHPDEDDAEFYRSVYAQRGWTFLRTIRISSEDTDRYAEGWDAAIEAVVVPVRNWLHDEDDRAVAEVIRDLKGKANA